LELLAATQKVMKLPTRYRKDAAHASSGMVTFAADDATAGIATSAAAAAVAACATAAAGTAEPGCRDVGV
jgi:hypothetical protein